MSDSVEVPGFQELTLAVSNETMNTLEQLSRDTDRSLGDVLQEAIKLEKFYRDLRARGGRIYVEEDGKTQELLSV